jgi:hypothetical protein
MTIVHKLIVKCHFTFFENTQGVSLRSVCVCVCEYLGLCVLVSGEGRDLYVFLCVCWEDRQRLRKKANPLNPVCEGFWSPKRCSYIGQGLTFKS